MTAINIKKNTLYIVLLFILVGSKVFSQNRIAPLRFEDNFLLLKNDTNKKGLDELKYISLGSSSYLSFGGELREQFQYFDNINFGDVPETYKNSSTGQLLHRAMFHANFEVGSAYRFFFQLNNTLRLFNQNPLVPEIEENQLSIHQAFADIKNKDWIFRVGKQELLYGNNRLISVREGPNTRLTFDGIVIKRKYKNGKIDVFIASPTISKPYIFDDDHFRETLLGIYATQFFYKRKIGLDYFVVSFQSNLRRYNYQSGYENRQTFGLRLFSNLEKLNFEFETAYQTGKFRDLAIAAYNVLADVNYIIFPGKQGKIGFVANKSSGDRRSTDKRLNTYNLLFAKPAYGLAVPIGSTNMISLYPYFQINPIPKLNLLAQLFFLSRSSNQDGTYSPAMAQNRPRPNEIFITNEKYLGELYVLEANYLQSKYLKFSLDYSYFRSGSYIKESGEGQNISYLSFKTTIKF